MKQRLARIIDETGWRGLMVRVAARGLLATGDTLRDAGRHLLTAVPPHFYTRSQDRRRLAQNASLKNRHAGQTVFVIGNGPSLRREPVELLRGQTLMTTNQGHLFARKLDLKPRYHAFVDEVFLEPRFDALLADFAAFQKETGATLLTTIAIADRMRALGLTFDAFETKYFLIATLVGNALKRHRIDMTAPQFGFESAPHFCARMALYMGFSRICMLGCDLDYFLSPDTAYQHSYDYSPHVDESATTRAAWNWGQIELMQWCLNEYRSFEVLADLAQKQGARLLNASSGGAMQVLDRVPLAEIVAEPDGAPVRA